MATESSYQVRDASGDVLTLRGYAVDGVKAPAPFVPEIGEAADAAWSGTGPASVIAALKGLYARLGGVILAAGSAVIGRVGLQVSGADLSAANPVPVTAVDMASGKTAVAATFTATGVSASFAPVSRRGFNVSLWGTFVGAVRLERSFDGGTTWLPLTAAGIALYAWTAPASEIAEEPETGVIYRLSCTAFTSGTINYRVSQ